MKVDQMKGIKHPFTYEHFKKRIENEKRIINTYCPAVVVIGTTLSMFISARACQTPLVYIKPLAYTRTFLLKGHLELPSIINKLFLPKKFTMNLYKKVALGITYKPKSFSKLAKEEGVELPKYTIDADYNLITTIPEISGVDDLPANYKYIGPVYAKLDTPIPSFLDSLPTNHPVIYFAMGSSGSKEIVMKILHVLKKLPVIVICPMKKILASSCNVFSSNKNIILCDLLPTHKLGNIIDLSIIHGGEGTVQTACLSGKPFLGLGLQAEQKININECILFGNALALKRKDITTKKLGGLIQFSLTNKEMHDRAEKMQELLEDIDGPVNAANFLINHFAIN
ncbi:glycosyltransferase [Bacillus thuringiensis]|uniref:glycosyltransferase n=1 Tax=Bacillus thuringiensis TaxID=1428 RepID=UPI001F2B0EE9|nr:glycosyl transferase [Bacillus thuringiensis]